MNLKGWFPAAGLAALAVVTAVVASVALVHGSPKQATPQPGEWATTGSSSSDAPSSSSSGSASASSKSRSAGAVLTDIRALWRSGDELDVLVLGDESGAGDDGWVRQLAADVAKERPVVYLDWKAGERDYGKAEMGQGEDGVLNLYNVSIPDATARSLTDVKDSYGDSSPDIVILSFGNHEKRDQIGASYDALIEALPGDPMVVALLQNPHAEEGSQRENARAIKGWGKQTNTPIFDVFFAFTKDERPLSELLKDDGLLPNKRGSQLWAEYVHGELEKS